MGSWGASTVLLFLFPVPLNGNVGLGSGATVKNWVTLFLWGTANPGQQRNTPKREKNREGVKKERGR